MSDEFSELFCFDLFRDNEVIPNFEVRTFGLCLTGDPVGRFDFPDAASEIVFQGNSIVFRLAINGDTDTLASFERFDDSIGISRDAFVPGIFPFGGG